MTASPRSPVTIVTTCMGRLAFLQKTLPTWLENTSFGVVVVDYSCPDGTATWVESCRFGDRVRVIRAEAECRGDQPVFHLSRARNIGANIVRAGYVFFLDADHGLRDGLGDWLLARLRKRRMLLPARPARGGGQLGGAMVVHAQAFHAVGGFDEALVGWGSEDTEMKLRLHHHGLLMMPIPYGYVEALPHPNVLRTEHYEDKDLQRSQLRNRDYLNQKYLRATGKTYSDWVKERYVRFALCLTRTK